MSPRNGVANDLVWQRTRWTPSWLALTQMASIQNIQFKKFKTRSFYRQKLPQLTLSMTLMMTDKRLWAWTLQPSLLSMDVVGFIILRTFTKFWGTISLLSNEFCFQWLSQPQFFLINWGSNNLHSDQAENAETTWAPWLPAMHISPILLTPPLLIPSNSGSSWRPWLSCTACGTWTASKKQVGTVKRRPSLMCPLPLHQWGHAERSSVAFCHSKRCFLGQIWEDDAWRNHFT